MTEPAATPFALRAGDVTLAGEATGAGPAVLLAHGLTATRRYVVHGSRTLVRSGRRTLAYDARGHGESSPAPEGPAGYAYPALADDALAVLDAHRAARAAVVGVSMGSATALALALAHPDRVAALVVVTPAHRGRPSPDPERWDRLAAALEGGGPEGFLAALEPLEEAERFRATIRTVVVQRLARHRHPRAVADALRGVPRSAAFDGLDALTGVSVPTLIVGSRDEVDGGHPLAVAEEYAARIPGAELVVEAEGESPLAWRGGLLSQRIVAFLDGVPGA